MNTREIEYSNYPPPYECFCGCHCGNTVEHRMAVCKECKEKWASESDLAHIG